MRPALGVISLAIACASVYGQSSIPAAWLGTWTLNLQLSKIEAPAGLTVVSQTLKLVDVSGKLHVSGDTVMSDNRFSAHDEFSAELNGQETATAPGISGSLLRIDQMTFEIIVKMDRRDANLVGTNRFVFSPDGKTLTETKTQVERDAEGTVLRTSTSVLVFQKS